MGRTIFGAHDKRIAGLTEEYCIVKLERLAGPLRLRFGIWSWILPWGGNLITVLPLPEELERISDPPIPPALIDLIESLLVTDMVRDLSLKTHWSTRIWQKINHLSIKFIVTA